MTEVAAASGVPAETLRKIETGRIAAPAFFTVAALKEAGIDYEYLLFPDEGHGFAKPENRLKFYAAAERFLARHLGGRAEE